MYHLDSKDLHIWLVFIEQVTSKSLLEKYTSLLVDEERTQYKAFKKPEDRLNYLISRAVIKTTLSSYLGILPLEVIIYRDSNGKPQIQSKGPQEINLSFNLTHTEGLIALAVSKSRHVGIDAECVTRSIEFMDIAKDNFSQNEYRSLELLPVQNQQYRFYKLWTLKESYLKARGEGLSIPLAYTSFGFSKDGCIQCNFDGKLNDNPSAWQFRLFSPTDKHIVAASVLSYEDYLSVHIRGTVPLERKESILNFELLSNHI